MKLVLLSIFLLSPIAYAQFTGEYIPGETPLDMTVYAGPEMKATNLNNEGEILAGLRGGIIFNESYGISIAWYSKVTKSELGASIYRWEQGDSIFIVERFKKDYNLICGGIILEKIFQINHAIRLSFGNLLGGGRISYFNNAKDNFMLIEPEFNSDINIYRHIRLKAGISYLIIFMPETELMMPPIGTPITSRLKDDDITAVSFNLQLKIGTF